MRSSIFVVTVLATAVIAAAGMAAAQQSKSQQACIQSLNAGAAKMGQLQGRENLACLKNAGTGKLTGSAQICLTADAKSKVAGLQTKIASAETKNCTSAPTLAYTDAATVSAAAQVGRLDALADLFGSDLDASVIPCATNKDACKCQLTVARAAEKMAATKWKIFNLCKKKGLKAGAASVAEVEACVSDALTPGSLAADSSGKLQALVDKLGGKIGKVCDTPNVTAAAFAMGECSAETGAGLATCINEQIDCRVCQTINQSDDLHADCDVYDDGNLNESCGCSPLNTSPCDDGNACTLNDIECGGGPCSGTEIAPNLFAAISKQLVSVDQFDTVRLTIEILTVTRQPFRLTATGLNHPGGFELESISTAPCTESAGPSFRCRHTAVLEATFACEGDGSYQMGLAYNCSPDVAGCSLCDDTTNVNFSLDTENFC